MTPFQAWAWPPGMPAPDAVHEAASVLGDPPFAYPGLGSDEVAMLAQRLREGARRLRGMPATRRADLLGSAGERFLATGDSLRAEALRLLPPLAGLSPAMATAVLDGMAADWTAHRIHALLESEFPEPAALDGFVTGMGGIRTRAAGRPLTVHVGAGNVPGVAVTSIIRALVVGSAALVKPARGDVVLPVLFARALSEEAPELAAALAVAYWPGGSVGTQGAVFDVADLVVAFGSDDAVRSIRDRLPVSTPLVAYHHRLSVAAVGRDVLSDAGAPGIARLAARAVALFDQRGCVSPHVVYVEEGGVVSPRAWTRLLAEELDAVGRALPAGPLALSEASALQQERGTIELLRAAGHDVEIHRAPGLDWTVVFEADPTFKASCLGRFVRVKPVADLLEVPPLLAGLRGALQTVALAGGEGRQGSLAEAFEEAGASRLTSLEAMPWPPPWWHHDGMEPLRSLVQWVDWEA